MVRRRCFNNKSSKNLNDGKEGERKMKKLFKVLGSIALSLSLIACGSSEQSTNVKTGTESTYAYLLDTTDLVKPELDLSNADGLLKNILDAGVLKVATSPDYPPAEFVDEEGVIHGSEMMLAKYVADCLGVDLQIETMDFSGTLAAVDTGKVDIAFSGYGWKKDRAESYNLTIGYIGDEDDEVNHTLITTKANEGKFKTLADFKGLKIMAQVTSLQEMYVQDQIVVLDDSTIYEPVATLDQAILGLASGKCDAVALDGSTAENYVTQSQGEFALTGVDFDLTLYEDVQGNIGAIKKGEDSLLEVVNQIIQTVKDNQYYSAWYAQAKEEAGIE